MPAVNGDTRVVYFFQVERPDTWASVGCEKNPNKASRQIEPPGALFRGGLIWKSTVGMITVKFLFCTIAMDGRIQHECRKRVFG